MNNRENFVGPRGQHWEKKPPLEGIAKTVSSKSLFDILKRWTRSEILSLFSMENSCCFRELERIAGPSPQGKKFREEFPSGQSVEDCDVLVVTGILNDKVAPYVLELYEKMEKPRYVVAVGTCAASGAVFDTLAADELLPIDVYISGCPPTLQSIGQGLELLKERVRKGASVDYHLGSGEQE